MAVGSGVGSGSVRPTKSSGSSIQRDRPNLVRAVSSSPSPPTRPSAATRPCARTCSRVVQPAEVANAFGYTVETLNSLVRDFRAGRREFFLSSRPGPKRAPGKERAHDRIVELRTAGHSIDEIALVLAREGIALNRTGIAEVIAEEGFERLWRRPEQLRGAPRREQLPRTGVIDFDTWPERVETKHAGLLLCVPDLVALDLPAIVKAAGYPGTAVIPALSSVLSLLALKLASIQSYLARRGSRDRSRRGAVRGALLAAEDDRSDELLLQALAHERQHAFLVALNTGDAAGGTDRRHRLRPRFPRDHALGRGPGAGETLRSQPLATHPLGADVLRPRRQHPQPHLRQRRYLKGDPRPRGDRVLRALAPAGRLQSRLLVFDQKLTTQAVLAELDERAVTFMTLRMRSPALIRHIDQLDPKAWRTVRLDRDGNYKKPQVVDETVRLSDYPHPIRQLVIRGLGRDSPTVLITNHSTATPKFLIERYARRMTIEQRLAEAIRAFHLDSLASSVPLNVDLDVVLSVLANTICAALRRRLPGYHTATPDTLQRRLLQTGGLIHTTNDTITVRLDRRAYSPVLRSADLPDTTVPWWNGRQLRYEFAEK